MVKGIGLNADVKIFPEYEDLEVMSKDIFNLIFTEYPYMEKRYKVLKSFNKSKLIFEALERGLHYDNLKKAYKERGVREAQLNNLITNLTNELKEIRSGYKNKDLENAASFGIKPGKRVFAETLSAKGLIRTYDGMFVKETINHIIINISSAKFKWDYAIRKDMINDIGENKDRIKNIRKKSITGMKVYE